MATDFALLLLSPVGYKASKLHRLLIDFQVQAFTVSCPLRQAFGYYAVCWLLLNHSVSYPMLRYRFSSIRSFQSMRLKSQGTYIPVPHWLTTDRLLSRSPQIRTWTVPAQLHHLRWPLDHLASSSCANSPSAYASYDVLVHQLAVLRPASSRPDLTVKPLPFASS